MVHESHRWDVGSHPPEIRSHSLKKHVVIEEYLKRYVATLTRNPRIEKLQLTLIDGFAGGNVYRDWKSGEEKPGSPSVILDAIADSGRAAREKRVKPFVIDDYYFFIEQAASHFESLTKTLNNSRFKSQIGNNIQIINGDFVNYYDSIIDFIRERGRAGRSIFVLDQCGYAAVPFQAVRTILERLENAEVILTFATDFLIDYLSSNSSTQAMLANLGISLPTRSIETEKSKSNWRRAIQFSLHREIQQRTNAKFYTPFFIRSKDSHRDFWLIHLSGHHRARDVMVGLHWELNNSFAHYGKPGLNMLGYDPDQDPSLKPQTWLPGFFFDETAKNLTLESLYTELPSFLHRSDEPIDFKTLFSKISNETPATSDILREVIRDLTIDGVISVRDRTGLTSRRVGAQDDSDIIIINKQKRLFLWEPLGSGRV